MTHQKRERVLFCMILPALIGFVIFYVYPTIMSFGYSFTNWSIYKRTIRFIGVNNFIEFFQDEKTLAAVWHSLKYSVLITVFQNILAILFAVLLNRKVRFAETAKTLLFLPAVLSIMVVGYLFQYMMTSADYGLFNNILSFFGIQPINWLGDPRLALYSVLITQVWQWTGYSMVIYIANLKSIDGNLYEAAAIDGAGEIQTFFRVTLPLLYPAASFNILTCLIGGLKLYDAVISLTKGGPGYATETILTTMIREGFSNGRNAYACAIAVVFFVVVTVITQLLTWMLNRWREAIS